MDYYSKYKYYKKKYKSYKNSIGGTIECKQDGNKYKIEGSQYSTPEAKAINILWKGNDNKTIYTGLCSDNKQNANFIHYRSKNSSKLFGINLEKWWGNPNEPIDKHINGYFENNNILSDSPLRQCPRYYFLKLCPYQRQEVIQNLTDSIRQRQVSGKVVGADGAVQAKLFELNEIDLDKTKAEQYHGCFYDKSLIKSLKVFTNLQEDRTENQCCYDNDKLKTSCHYLGVDNVSDIMRTKTRSPTSNTNQSIINTFYADIVDLIYEKVKDQEEIDYRMVDKRDILKELKSQHLKDEDKQVNSIKPKDIQMIIDNMPSGKL
jgi:hypothetical protein